jgi:hypothetical protein
MTAPSHIFSKPYYSHIPRIPIHRSLCYAIEKIALNSRRGKYRNFIIGEYKKTFRIATNFLLIIIIIQPPTKQIRKK